MTIKKNSIQIKLMLFSIILSIVFFITIGSLFFKSTKEAINASKEKEFISLSKETSNKIERYMFERHGDIEVMANSPLLKRNNIDNSLKLEYLNNVRAAYKAYDFILITDADGNPQVVSGNIIDKDDYEKIVPKALEGNTFVSDFVYFKDTKAYGVYFAAPIFSESNKIIGTVIERMNFNAIIDIVKNVKLGNKGYADLIDNNDNYILNRYSSSNKIKNLEDKENKAFYVKHNNVNYFCALYPLNKYSSQKNNWYIIVEEPVSEAFEITYRFRNYTIIVLIISMIIVFVLVSILSKKITRPIKKLLKETQDIAEGETYKNIEIGSTDEIGCLAESFNVMLNNLKFMMQQVLKASEEAASMSQIRQYADKFFEDVPSAIVTIDGYGKITTFNHVACKILKMNEACLGKNIKNIDSKLFPLTKLLEDGLEKGVDYIKYVVKLPDACHNEIPIIVTTKVQRDSCENIIGVIGVFRSAQEMKLLEESINRAKNLESLGALSAGMAHEIRNPLTSIKGYAQYIKMELGEESSLNDDISIIISEVDRLNGIVDRFLAFARPKELILEAGDVNLAIRSVIDLLKTNSIKGNIKQVIKLEEVPKTLLDYDQFKQVIINLVVNAVQAMPKGGALQISTCYVRTLDIIEVNISDTGCGILPEDQDKIFEPYFTTKEKGIGLGLAICARIIENHKGVIEVSSTPKKGTTFTIKLPVIN